MPICILPSLTRLNSISGNPFNPKKNKLGKLQFITLVIGVSEILAVDFPGYPPNFWEHSVYADPRPAPAPNAVDAHRVTGLPMIIMNTNE